MKNKTTEETNKRNSSKDMNDRSSDRNPSGNMMNPDSEPDQAITSGRRSSGKSGVTTKTGVTGSDSDGQPG